MASKTIIGSFVMLWVLTSLGIRGRPQSKIHHRGPHRLERGQEGNDMDSLDNVRERIEALEQQMQVRGTHIRTVERRLRWRRGIAESLLLLGLMLLPAPTEAQQVGQDSCVGSNACTGNTGSVGDDACRGDQACISNQSAVGDDACRGE